MNSEVTEDTETLPENQRKAWEIPSSWNAVSGGISSTNDGVLGWGRGPADAVSAARQVWARREGVIPETCVSLDQTHGTALIEVNSLPLSDGLCNPESRQADTDGLITHCVGATLITSHADCAPIFLFDPATRTIALLHSGWKGTLAGISEQAVNKLRDNFSVAPQNLQVAVGPMIGTRSYEVSLDLADQFTAKFGPSVVAMFDGRPHLDLFASIVIDLLRAGVESARHCPRPPDTYTSTLWSSFRRDGERAGGMLAYLRLDTNS